METDKAWKCARVHVHAPTDNLFNPNSKTCTSCVETYLDNYITLSNFDNFVLCWAFRRVKYIFEEAKRRFCISPYALKIWAVNKTSHCKSSTTWTGSLLFLILSFWSVFFFRWLESRNLCGICLDQDFWRFLKSVHVAFAGGFKDR